MPNIECVFGDWRFSLLADAVAVYRPGGVFPLAWNGAHVCEVSPSAGLAETMSSVALAAHWAAEHPNLLSALVGDFELRRT